MLCIACLRGNDSLLNYCLTLVDFSSELVGSSLVPLQHTILHSLVPNVELCRLLLDNGLVIDRNSTFTPGINSNSQQTVAYFALKALGVGVPDFELLNLLFERGLVVSDYLIESAAAKNNPELMQYLLSKSVSRPKDSRALLRAVYANNRLVVETLVNDGMDVNYNPGRDCSLDPFDGRPSDTPLHAAAEGGHIDMVRLLLERGAKKEGKDSHGRTAAERAKGFGHADVAELIQNWA